MSEYLTQASALLTDLRSTGALFLKRSRRYARYRSQISLFIIGILLLASSLTMFDSNADSLKNLKDPTKPDRVSSTSTSTPSSSTGPVNHQLKLRSILISPSRRVAVINGEALLVGERINNAIVKTIAPNKVILSTPSSEIELQLNLTRRSIREKK